ncbi:MAG: hypothetical protein NTX00_00150 [Candidatus Parcubacteria bacterium]|nr:hypothetical protein [Candidatus Parcubacteria bacterium]
MKKILFIIFIITVFFLAGCGNINISQPPKHFLTNNAGNLNEQQKSAPTTNEVNLNKVQPEASLVVLNSLVLDKSSKKPVVDAFVYIGTGFWQCQTDNQGGCTITNKQFAPGDYGVGAYKKGYQRTTIMAKFVPGENSLTLEIEPTLTPQALTLTGIVKEIVSAPGSKSENRVDVIKTDNGKEYYLFNNIGENTGFENYVGKKVTITGYIDNGFVGWQHNVWSGIYVEEIK